jgi:hypothetical protein
MEETLTSDTTIWIVWAVVAVIAVGTLPFVVRMQSVTNFIAMCFG